MTRASSIDKFHIVNLTTFFLRMFTPNLTAQFIAEVCFLRISDDVTGRGQGVVDWKFYIVNLTTFVFRMSTPNLTAKFTVEVCFLGVFDDVIGRGQSVFDWQILQCQFNNSYLANVLSKFDCEIHSGSVLCMCFWWRHRAWSVT